MTHRIEDSVVDQELHGDFPHISDIAKEAGTQISRVLDRRLPPQPDLPNGHENVSIPAGYTYLGQLVVHDLVFSDTRRRELEAVGRLPALPRSPALDLDCLYGGGPAASPWLYEPGRTDAHVRYRFALGAMRKPVLLARPNFQLTESRTKEDIRRVRCPMVDGVGRRFDPLIADPRNDDNVVLSQLVVLFMKLHNQVVDLIVPQPGNLAIECSAFDEARDIVRSIYRTIVLEDFLPKLISAEVYKKYHQPPQQERQFQAHPHSEENRRELEYALRLCHVMVSSSYSYNDQHDSADLNTLLNLVGLANPKCPLGEDWVIDWSRFFFDPGNAAGGRRRNFAQLFLPRMANSMNRSLTTEDGQNHLIYIDTLRGAQLGVHTGQELADIYRFPPLGPDAIRKWCIGTARDHNGRLVPNQASEELVDHTPLLFYLLCEAADFGAGRHLGPLGSTLFAELLYTAAQDERAAEQDGKARARLGARLPGDMMALIQRVTR